MRVTEAPGLPLEEYFLLFFTHSRDAHFLDKTITEMNAVFAAPKTVQL